MNIILVAKSHSTPRCIDLGSNRGRMLAGSLIGATFLLFAGIGFIVALLTVNPRDAAMRELSALRTQISVQKGELGNLESDSRRNLDALAMQIGQLRAQATRLNALGDRLTQVGKLEDGEFDFAAEPALGGPEETLAATDSPLPLGNDINSLRAEFERLAPWPVEWIDPASAIARRVVAVAGATAAEGEGGGQAFLTSGKAWPEPLSDQLRRLGLATQPAE